MKVAIVLLLAVAAVSAAPKPKTTPYVFPGLNHRIVGGVEATPHEFPFIVDMRRGSHYCAGSIISPEWVVTAAHCSQSAASGYTLTAGDHNIQATPDGREQVRQVVQIINHPRYGSPLQYENDIALMKVDPPFEFNEYVSAVIIPNVDFAPTAVATVTGWGALSEGGSSPAVLMKVDVPYVNDDDCNAAYGGDVANSMVCYGEGGKDSCQGDSGGPIVCGADKALCGIVSWGMGCARPGYPGVYTETSYYGEWIRSATTPTEEDEEPVTTVDTCGGLVDNSSAVISFMDGADLTPGQRCVWTVKGPYDSSRFVLTSSGLGADDHIFITRVDATTAAPGTQTELGAVGEDHVVAGGMVLVTLVVGDGASQGFSLEWYSSGFGDSSPALSGFATLSESIGSHKYPASGNYMNGEKAMFIVNPAEAGDRILKFSELDLESGSSCSYDAVTLYTWVNNRFTEQDRFCGTTPPSRFEIPGGLALITFTTDSSVVASGFTFDWA